MSEKPVLNPHYLDVYPLFKGKRMLVYLADLFINFIISLAIFSVAVYPLAQVVTPYGELSQENERARFSMLDLLYDNNLLDYEGDDKYNFDDNLKDSADLYLISFLQDDRSNDYIFNFYITEMNEGEEKLKEVYQSCDSRSFFNYNSSRPELKEEYKNEFMPLLDSKDTLSEQANNDYSYFTNSFFTNIYSTMLNELLTSDSIKEGDEFFSYRENQIIIDTNTTILMNIIMYATYVAYFLGSLISFLVIPLVSKRGKTIGMMTMKIERVGVGVFKTISRLERCINFVYLTIFSLPLIMFTPLLYLGFSTLFSLNQLVYVTLVSLALVVISMFVIIFSKMNRSLSDYLTRSILITSEMLEMIYAAKGYPN